MNVYRKYLVDEFRILRKTFSKKLLKTTESLIDEEFQCFIWIISWKNPLGLFLCLSNENFFLEFQRNPICSSPRN